MGLPLLEPWVLLSSTQPIKVGEAEALTDWIARLINDHAPVVAFRRCRGVQVEQGSLISL